MLISHISYAQHFTKYPGNPVFTPINIVYEQRGIGSPSVIFKNDTFHMLYASGSTDGRGYISYAFSTNGINWIRYNNGVPILFPYSAGWDSFFLDTPEFLYNDSLKKFVMYYFGDTDSSPEGGAIGIAVSDNLKTWIRYSANPVLTPGASDEWDGLFVESPSVAYAWGRYWMVYTGVDSLWRPRIGLAVSSDGFNWVKFPGNPIIVPKYEWESLGVATPTILFDGTSLRVWYCSASIDDFSTDNKVDTLYVSVAWSNNGIQWNQDLSVPLISSITPPPDMRGPWAPDVVYIPDSGKYYMWYETAVGFGLATAKDTATYNLLVKPLSNGKLFIITEKYLWTPNKENILIYNNSGALLMAFNDISGFIDISFLPTGIYFICIGNSQSNCHKLTVIR